MNSVGNHARLAWSLLVRATWVPVAIIVFYGATLFGTFAEGEGSWVTWIAYLLVNSGMLVGLPLDHQGYRALNLSSGLYRRHSLISLTIRFLAVIALLIPIIVRAQQLGWWIVGGILLALYLWQALSRRSLPEPGGLLERARGRGITTDKEGRRGEVVVKDLASELIVKPQRRLWLGGWAAAFLAAALWMLLTWELGDGPVSLAQVAGIVCFALIFVAASGTISSTLTTWVSFGGSRLRWAQRTRWVLLVHPAIGTAVVAVVALIDEPQHPSAPFLPLIGALVVPVVICLLELAQRDTALFYAAAAVLLAAATIAALIAGQGWLAFAVAVAGFVGFQVALPKIARTYDPFSGGLSDYLGLKPARV